MDYLVVGMDGCLHAYQCMHVCVRETETERQTKRETEKNRVLFFRAQRQTKRDRWGERERADTHGSQNR